MAIPKLDHDRSLPTPERFRGVAFSYTMSRLAGLGFYPDLFLAAPSAGASLLRCKVLDARTYGCRMEI
jgi:hypothetical protein